jgi:hypothetical protein
MYAYKERRRRVYPYLTVLIELTFNSQLPSLSADCSFNSFCLMQLLALTLMAAITAAPIPTPFEDSKLNYLAAAGAVGAVGAAVYLHQNPETASQIMKAGSILLGSGSKFESAGKGTLYEETIAVNGIMHNGAVDVSPSLGELRPAIYHGGVRKEYVPIYFRRPKGSLKERLVRNLRGVGRRIRKMKAKETGTTKKPWNRDAQYPKFSPSEFADEMDESFFAPPKKHVWLDESDEFVVSSQGVKSGMTSVSPKSQAGTLGMAPEIAESMGFSLPSSPKLNREALHEAAHAPLEWDELSFAQRRAKAVGNSHKGQQPNIRVGKPMMETFEPSDDFF